MGQICLQALRTSSIFSACAAMPLTVHLLRCCQYWEHGDRSEDLAASLKCSICCNFFANFSELGHAEVRSTRDSRRSLRRIHRQEGKRCMLAFLKLVADFSRGCAHPAMHPPIPTTHPHPTIQRPEP